eukprot:CAMPEP_0119121998 /NCGR_PEP_ID=MMETSP1310-20130426/2382_1 /TAXON_ID=464262 /ORGANISM="Genus nov. species nov., Strain RCC2339" /LENGTH=583 /DNA_ID=CAMNT_0007111599 /DNA_START=612 /DNA_END=2366 /DNA_ORIENTATION=-
MGNQALAMDTYAEALALFPDSVDLHMHRCRFGVHLFNRFAANQDIVPVSTIYDSCVRVTELQPDHYEGWQLSAVTHTLLNNFDLASSLLKKTLSLLSPEDAPYSQILGNLVLNQLRAGQTEEALEFSSALYKAFPNDQGALDIYSNVMSILRVHHPEAVDVRGHAFDMRLRTVQQDREFLCTTKGRTLQTVAAWPNMPPGVGTVTEIPWSRELFPRRRMPATEGTTWFSDKTSYLIRFEPGQANLVSREGLVFSDCLLYLGGYRKQFPIESMSHDIPGVRKEFGNPRSIYISSFPLFNPRNYFHWIAESLVRILMIVDSLDDTDFTVLLPSHASHIVESLEFMGIPRARTQVLNVANLGEYYNIRGTLLMADWSHDNLPNTPTLDEADELFDFSMDSWAIYSAPRRSLLLLRDAVHARIGKPHYSDGKTHIVFISRGSGKADGIRSIANEDDVVRYLKEEIHRWNGPRNLDLSIHTGSESFAEQVDIFYKADIIIGAHGAGLVNMVFCRPNAKVIIFPMEPHCDHTYEYISSALGLDYWIVSDVTSYYYKSYGSLSEKQMESIVETVRSAVSALPDASARDEL